MEEGREVGRERGRERESVVVVKITSPSCEELGSRFQAHPPYPGLTHPFLQKYVGKTLGDWAKKLGQGIGQRRDSGVCSCRAGGRNSSEETLLRL